MRLLPIPMLSIIAAAALVSGCSTNPVTGESEINLISTEQEIATGAQSFAPYRQAQGGDYVVDPEVRRYVQRVGLRLAAVSDRALPYEFAVVNDSTPNAWALPGGKIAVNRGLLVELHSEAELAAVLAHEIIHAAAGHGAQNLQFEMLREGVLAVTNVALAGSRYQGAALVGAQVGAGLLGMKYGRDDEREADHYGIRYMQRAGYDPRAAVELQQTFVRIADDGDPVWLYGLFASHPPSQERIENNRRTVAELENPGGEVGRERYQHAMARLIRNRSAYEAYDEAVEAHARGDDEQALSKVATALDIEPEDALFHGLRAEILAAHGHAREAESAYDQAIGLNPGYFRHFLGRGLVRREQGDEAGAQRDLERSVQLLPTPAGQYALALFAIRQGRRDAAVDYLRAVVAVDSPVAEAALTHLVKLDLPSNPGDYVNTWVTPGPEGYLQVTVENATPVAVSGLRVVVSARRLLGDRERGSYEIDGTLNPGQRVTVTTDLGPWSADKARKYGATVTRADVVE